MSDAGKSARRELPTDPDALVPMGPAFDEAVHSGLAELDLHDHDGGSDAAVRCYEAQARLLREWGAAINLTAIRDPAEVARRHVIDSLSAVPSLRRLAGTSLLDIGSGAGYPGLPLAVALDLKTVELVDSVGKKARFLGVASEAVGQILEASPLGRPAIEVANERAEDLAEEPDQRGAWDVVTARAVGSLAEVIELGMPLAREGGLVVAWKREDERHGLQAELGDAGSIIRAAGGGRPEVVDVAADVPSLPGHRLVIVPKERATPASYPRPAGRRRRR